MVKRKDNRYDSLIISIGSCLKIFIPGTTLRELSASWRVARNTPCLQQIAVRQAFSFRNPPWPPLRTPNCPVSSHGWPHSLASPTQHLQKRICCHIWHVCPGHKPTLNYLPCQGSVTYLIFVIFFTQAKILDRKFYTEERVNYGKRISRQNSVNCDLLAQVNYTNYTLCIKLHTECKSWVSFV